jgi:hypothetical protein
LVTDCARLPDTAPLAPSPRRVELTYRDGQGEHTIVIDTRESLDGLHIQAGKDVIDSAG